MLFLYLHHHHGHSDGTEIKEGYGTQGNGTVLQLFGSVIFPACASKPGSRANHPSTARSQQPNFPLCFWTCKSDILCFPLRGFGLEGRISDGYSLPIFFWSIIILLSSSSSPHLPFTIHDFSRYHASHYISSSNTTLHTTILTNDMTISGEFFLRRIGKGG